MNPFNNNVEEESKELNNFEEEEHLNRRKEAHISYLQYFERNNMVDSQVTFYTCFSVSLILHYN